jgi:hypothetical protein
VGTGMAAGAKRGGGGRGGGSGGGGGVGAGGKCVYTPAKGHAGLYAA